MFQKIKKILLGAVLVWGVLFVPQFASAQYYGLEETVKRTGYETDATVESSVSRVVSALLALLSIIFFILVTYAGFRWMLSRGNEEVAIQAKGTLEAAVIGLIIVLAAYAITSFIFTRLENVTEESGGVISNACEAFTTESSCISARSIECRWSRVQSRCESSAPVDRGCGSYRDAEACDASSICYWEGDINSGECKDINSVTNRGDSTTYGACWSVKGSGANITIECSVTTRDNCPSGKQFEARSSFEASEAFCEERQDEINGLGGGLECWQKDRGQCGLASGVCEYVSISEGSGCVELGALAKCDGPYQSCNSTCDGQDESRLSLCYGACPSMQTVKDCEWDCQSQPNPAACQTSCRTTCERECDAQNSGKLTQCKNSCSITQSNCRGATLLGQ